jgi:S1-C subfamily serine protease
MLGLVLGVFYNGWFRPERREVPVARSPRVIAEAQPVAMGGDLSTALAFDRVVASVAKRAMPAVVSVHTSGTVVYRFRDPFYDMFYGPQRKQFNGWGSGVIIDPDHGIIITNNHVVRESGQLGDIDVNLTDGRKFRAKVIREFPDQDLAVLKIDGKNLPYLSIASSQDIMPGQTVLAIGNPFGDALNGGLSYSEPTITRGIISATRRNLDVPIERGGTRYLRNMLQTDAAINPGNSGGALINLQGELIGVNTAIYSETGGSVGIGFAIPANRVRLILDYVRAGKDIGQGYTGIWVQDITERIAQSLRFTERGGSLVTKVENGSPGDKSELKRGDIIFRVNGFNIGNSEELVSMFRGAVPGEAFTLSVYREGKAFDTELKLELPPG